MASRSIVLVALALTTDVAADKLEEPKLEEPEVTHGRRLGACDDSTTWYKDKPKKDCTWVAKNTAARCGKKNAAGVRAKFECPVTCNTCPAPACADGCCDSTLWNFGKPIKNCDWAGKKPAKKAKRCGKTGSTGKTGYEDCKVTCGTCPIIPDLVGTISNYPGYTPTGGDPVVTGTCSASDSGGQFSFSGDLSSLEADTEGGYHIHSGTTCDDASLVGGHYFDNGGDCDALDPWFSTYGAVWTSDANGDAAPVNVAPASKVPGQTGGPYTIDGPTCPVTGRACVVHAAGTGARIGCGLLEPVVPALSGTLETYPGYTGSLDVTGTCTADVVDGEFVFAAELAGLETSTSGGIHIHSGDSCDDAADVGGHYFDSSADCDAPDPWFSVYGATWTSDAAGMAKHENIGPTDALGGGPFTIDGANCPVTGRTCVVHDSTGTRVACAVLSPPPSGPVLTATLSNYPGYTPSGGDPEVTGTCKVEIDSEGDFIFSGTLSGLESGAIGGFHIHEGTTCATAGGHYYNNGGDCDAADPWFTQYGAVWSTTITEDSDTPENVNPASKVPGQTGGPYTINGATCPVIGRTCVVHASDGTRIACGVLEL